MTSENHSILLVTKNSTISSLVGALLVPPMFDLTIRADFNEARRCCADRVFNIVLVDFADGEGTNFAIDISDATSTVILIAPTQYFDHISYKVEPYGILTMTSPFDQFYFYNMIKVAIAVQYKVQILSSQTTKLREKMEEIRLVNRAKILLMQNKRMTEQEAHRFIEKEAMDTGSKKTAVAQNIIQTLN